MPCLTDEQLAHFDEEGYLLVRGMLDVDEVIQPIIDEYHGVLDKLARELYQAGQIASTYDDLPFGKRLTQIVVESGQIHAQYFDFSLPQTGIDADTPFWAGPAVFAALPTPISSTRSSPSSALRSGPTPSSTCASSRLSA